MKPPHTAWPACPSERLALLIPERARKGGVETLEGYCDLTDREATGHLSRTASQRRTRRPRAFIDDRGEVVFLVPLDKAGAAWATVDASDWFRLQEGGANGLWGLAGGPKPKVRTYPALSGRGRKYVYIGRVILGLGEGGQVGFVNGDPLDLRRFNLRAMPCGDPRLGSAWGPVKGGAARRNKARSEGHRYDLVGTKG